MKCEDSDDGNEGGDAIMDGNDSRLVRFGGQATGAVFMLSCLYPLLPALFAEK